MLLSSTTLNCKLCKSAKTKNLYKTFSSCKECSCVFNENFSDTKKLSRDHYYETNSSLSTINNLIKMRFWDVISQQYVKYIKSKTSMKFNNAIDIGALYGHLVKQLNNLGINTLGIEVNKNFLDHDVSGKISHDYFDETFQFDKKFDLICLTQMIYYVENPILVIKKAVELLTDDGIIFISTQNPESPIIQDLKLPSVFEHDMNILLSKNNFLDTAKKLDLKLIDFTNFRPDIYLDRLKNPTGLTEFFNYFKYHFKSPYEEDPNGHHSFLILSKK